VYGLLEGRANANIAGYVVVLALGIVALAGAMLTPWNKVLVTDWALRALYGWSLYGVGLIGLSIYFDGGGSSAIFITYAVLAAFFAIAYPPRAQAVLFGFIVATYLAAVGFRSWNISAAALYMRLATLALMAYVASLLSSWLVSEMHDRATSTSAAEQRAGMLDTVARAARRVSSLDASQVLGGALAGAVELGCAAAEIWLFEGEPRSLQLQSRVSLREDDVADSARANELFGKARLSGATQIVPIDEERVVACMLFREGEPAGLLLARASELETSDALFVECLELLAAQVSAGLDVARNVAERRGLEERLAHWAFHDALTNLPNRVLFADRLELALARTVRDNTMVAVLFLDLDDFKGINDTLGHAAGDELLSSVAHRIHACLRPNDTLARYGGDEFVVLVEGVDHAEAATGVAERILEALSRPVAVVGTELQVKTSIGIALAAQAPGADADVLRRADMAMYDAKTSGGSCYVLSTAPDKRSRARNE
jgi:diguanylate cyclase (GGDEF)-like protein